MRLVAITETAGLIMLEKQSASATRVGMAKIVLKVGEIETKTLCSLKIESLL